MWKISDFGISSKILLKSNLNETTTSTFSNEIDISGTPNYMSPELY